MKFCFMNDGVVQKIKPWIVKRNVENIVFLKVVFVKNERGYSDKKALLIATNLTSICCVYKEKIDKDVSYRRA